MINYSRSLASSKLAVRIGCSKNTGHRRIPTYTRPALAALPALPALLLDIDVGFFNTAWAPNLNATSLAPQIFAFSIFPYIGFLYHLVKSEKYPRLTQIGFFFLLVFVFATIPAGIIAKRDYGTSLANVDVLHGAAESLLTVTNLLIVLGLRQALRDAENVEDTKNASK